MDEVKTRLTFETYENKFIWESPYNDVSMEDILNAVFGLCVAATWQPVTVIQAMKDYAEDHAYMLDNEEDEDEFTEEDTKPHFYA